MESRCQCEPAVIQAAARGRELPLLSTTSSLHCTAHAAKKWRPRRRSSRLTALAMPLSCAASHPHLSPTTLPRQQDCGGGSAFAGGLPRVPPSSASSTPLMRPRSPGKRKRRQRTTGQHNRRRRTTGQAHSINQLVLNQLRKDIGAI